jgi:hypothetical protein
MAVKAAITIVALQGLLLAACGGAAATQASTSTSRSAGETVVTTRTGLPPTTDGASRLPEGVPELLAPPPGAQIVPADSPGAIALQVGADASATLAYYTQKLTTSGYRIAQTRSRDGSSTEIVFGNGHDGGLITTSGANPTIEVVAHDTTFPSTPSLPKTFRLPTGVFRFDFAMIDGVAHHYLFVPQGGSAAADAIRGAATDAGYAVVDNPTPQQAGGTASLGLTGFGATARIDFYCANDTCQIELYRTS